MNSRPLVIGLVALTVAAPVASAATRQTRGKGTARRTVAAPKVVKPVAGARRVKAVVVTRAPVRVTRLAKATPGAKKAAPVAARRQFRLAQATAPEPAPSADAPMEIRAPAPVMISQEAEPLMTRALAAYYVMGDETVRALRSRGWEYGDIAAAGNVAARSRRPLVQVARAYEERRDWSQVARDMNLAPEQVYVASNSPRYVMIRPTPQEMEQMQIARLDAAYQRTLEQYRQSLAQAAPPQPDGRLAEAAPNATAPPPNGTAPPPNAPQPDAAVPPPAAQVPQPDPSAAPAPVTPDPTRVTTDYRSTAITPVERVASARLELAPTGSSALLRRAVAHYYALNPATIRDLEAQGWSMSDVLVAGNLAHRSEASFEEVVALRQGGEQWPGIAERIGVAADELHMPTMARRVESGDVMLLQEMNRSSDRSRERMNGSRERRPSDTERNRDAQPAPPPQPAPGEAQPEPAPAPQSP